MVNKEKVQSGKSFDLPKQSSREEITNDAIKSPSIKSLEELEENAFIPNPQPKEETYVRLDVPVLKSRETPPSSHIIPTPKSRETVNLGTHVMPIVE
jgi:hypothetical protein